MLLLLQVITFDSDEVELRSPSNQSSDCWTNFRMVYYRGEEVFMRKYMHCPKTFAYRCGVSNLRRHSAKCPPPMAQQSNQVATSTSTPAEDMGTYEQQVDITCSSCMEVFILSPALSCGHIFCKFCIENWRVNNSGRTGKEANHHSQIARSKSQYYWTKCEKSTTQFGDQWGRRIPVTYLLRRSHWRFSSLALFCKWKPCSLALPQHLHNNFTRHRPRIWLVRGTNWISQFGHCGHAEEEWRTVQSGNYYTLN